MPFCASEILQLATQIYTEIGSPTNQSVAWVSGNLTSSGALLASINTRLGTCLYLSGDSPCIVGMNPSEANIADLMYQTSYYLEESRRALTAAAAQGIIWTNVAEGDSRIQRERPSDIAKAYRELSKEVNERLTAAIVGWTLNHSVPASVDAQQTYTWPNPN